MNNTELAKIGQTMRVRYEEWKRQSVLERFAEFQPKAVMKILEHYHLERLDREEAFGVLRIVIATKLETPLK